MAWAKPEYPHDVVNGAGRKLATLEFPVSSLEDLDALAVINNWRASHAYPLNTFQITLRNKARKIEKNVIVAQRSKRLESIHRKLAAKQSMRMVQMQDIAGCRAVFKTMRSVQRLVKAYRDSKFDHKFRGEKDYINSPKPDGYRCYHLVYEYIGKGETEPYSELRVEVQIRTQMQHAWATAVEAVGIFTRQALKSNQGDQDWLRFFALMGSAIAAIERTPPVPGTPLSRAHLVDEIEALVHSLRVSEMLQVYNATISNLGSAKDAKYFIVQLDPDNLKILIRQYKAKESAEANRIYTELEGQLADDSAIQIVLVSVDNINALKRAYPNYFLDTNTFSRLVERVLERDMPDPLLL